MRQVSFFTKSNIVYIYAASLVRLRDLQVPYYFDSGYPFSWSNITTLCDSMYHNHGFFYWTINTQLQQNLRQKIKEQFQPPLYLDNTQKIPVSNILEQARNNFIDPTHSHPIFQSEAYYKIQDLFIQSYQRVLLEELKRDPFALFHHNLATFADLKKPSIYNTFLVDNGIIDRIWSRWSIDQTPGVGNQLVIQTTPSSEVIYPLNHSYSQELWEKVFHHRGYWNWSDGTWFNPKLYSYWYELWCEIFAQLYPYHFYWAKSCSGMGGGVLPSFAIFGETFYFNPEWLFLGFYFSYYWFWFVPYCVDILSAEIDEILPEGVIVTSSVYHDWWNEFRFDFCIPYLKFDPSGEEEEAFIWFALPFLLIPYYMDRTRHRMLWDRPHLTASASDYLRYIVALHRYHYYGPLHNDPAITPWMDELSPVIPLMARWQTRRFRQIPFKRNFTQYIWAFYDTRVGVLYATDERFLIDHFEKIFLQQYPGNTEDNYSDEIADSVIRFKDDFYQWRAFIWHGWTRFHPKTGAVMVHDSKRLKRFRIHQRSHMCDLDFASYPVSQNRFTQPLLHQTVEIDSRKFKSRYNNAMFILRGSRGNYPSESMFYYPYWTLRTKDIEHVEQEFCDTEGDIDSQYVMHSEGSLRLHGRTVFKHLIREHQQTTFYEDYKARHPFFNAHRTSLTQASALDAEQQNTRSSPTVFSNHGVDSDRDTSVFEENEPYVSDLTENTDDLRLLQTLENPRPRRFTIYTPSGLKTMTTFRTIDSLPISTYRDHFTMLDSLFTLLKLSKESERYYNKRISVDDLLLLIKLQLAKEVTSVPYHTQSILQNQFRDDLIFSIAHNYADLVQSQGLPFTYWLSPVPKLTHNEHLKFMSFFNFVDMINNRNLMSEAAPIGRALPQVNRILSSKRRPYETPSNDLRRLFRDTSPENYVKFLWDFQEYLRRFIQWDIEHHHYDAKHAKFLYDKFVAQKLETMETPVAGDFEPIEVDNYALKEMSDEEKEELQKMLDERKYVWQKECGDFVDSLRQYIEKIEKSTAEVPDFPLPGEMIFPTSLQHRIYIHMKPPRTHQIFGFYLRRDIFRERQMKYFNGIETKQVALLWDFFTYCSLAKFDGEALTRRIIALKDDPDLKGKPEWEWFLARTNLRAEYLFGGGIIVEEKENDGLEMGTKNQHLSYKMNELDIYYLKAHINDGMMLPRKMRSLIRKQEPFLVDCSVPRILSDMQLTNGLYVIPESTSIEDDKHQIFADVQTNVPIRFLSPALRDANGKPKVSEDFLQFYYGLDPWMSDDSYGLEYFLTWPAVSPWSEHLFEHLYNVASDNAEANTMMPIPNYKYQPLPRINWYDSYLPKVSVEDDPVQRMDSWYRTFFYARLDTLFDDRRHKTTYNLDGYKETFEQELWGVSDLASRRYESVPPSLSTMLEQRTSVFEKHESHTKLSLESLFDYYHVNFSYNLVDNYGLGKFRVKAPYKKKVAVDYLPLVDKDLVPELPPIKNGKELMRNHYSKFRHLRLNHIMAFYENQLNELSSVPDLEADAFVDMDLFEYGENEFEDLQEEENVEVYLSGPTAPALRRPWTKTRESLMALKDQSLLVGVYTIPQMSAHRFLTPAQARSAQTPADLFGIYCENSLGYTPFEWFDVLDSVTGNVVDPSPYLRFEIKDGLVLTRYAGFRRPEDLAKTLHSEFSLLEHVETLLSGFTELESVIGLEYAVMTYWSTYFGIAPGQVLDALVYGLYWSSNWLQFLYQGFFIDAHLESTFHHSDPESALVDYVVDPELLLSLKAKKSSSTFLSGTQYGYDTGVLLKPRNNAKFEEYLQNSLNERPYLKGKDSWGHLTPEEKKQWIHYLTTSTHHNPPPLPPEYADVIEEPIAFGFENLPEDKFGGRNFYHILTMETGQRVKYYGFERGGTQYIYNDKFAMETKPFIYEMFYLKLPPRYEKIAQNLVGSWLHGDFDNAGYQIYQERRMLRYANIVHTLSESMAEMRRNVLTLYTPAHTYPFYYNTAHYLENVSDLEYFTAYRTTWDCLAPHLPYDGNSIATQHPELSVDVVRDYAPAYAAYFSPESNLFPETYELARVTVKAFERALVQLYFDVHTKGGPPVQVRSEWLPNMDSYILHQTQDRVFHGMYKLCRELEAVLSHRNDYYLEIPCKQMDSKLASMLNQYNILYDTAIRLEQHNNLLKECRRNKLIDLPLELDSVYPGRNLYRTTWGGQPFRPDHYYTLSVKDNVLRLREVPYPHYNPWLGTIDMDTISSFTKDFQDTPAMFRHEFGSLVIEQQEIERAQFQHEARIQTLQQWMASKRSFREMLRNNPGDFLSLREQVPADEFPKYDYYPPFYAPGTEPHKFGNWNTWKLPRF